MTSSFRDSTSSIQSYRTRYCFQHPTLPSIAILPEVVAKLRTSPEPTVIVEPVKVTAPLLLIYALPLELTDNVEAAVLIALPEAPISPELEVRLTVAPVKVPEVSDMSPAALSVIVLVPAAVTLPATAILPELVVTKLNVSPLASSSCS